MKNENFNKKDYYEIFLFLIKFWLHIRILFIYLDV